MTAIAIYHNTTCGTSRNVLALIAAGGNVGETATSALALTVGGAMLGNAPTIEIEADSAITIRCGATSISITSGSVEFKSPTLLSPAAKIDKGASTIHHN